MCNSPKSIDEIISCEELECLELLAPLPECSEENHECTYNVYILCEGMIERETQTCDYDNAEKLFSVYKSHAKSLVVEANKESMFGESMTVSLYEKINGYFVMDAHID